MPVVVDLFVSCAADLTLLATLVPNEHSDKQYCTKLDSFIQYKYVFNFYGVKKMIMMTLMLGISRTSNATLVKLRTRHNKTQTTEI